MGFLKNIMQKISDMNNFETNRKEIEYTLKEEGKKYYNAELISIKFKETKKELSWVWEWSFPKDTFNPDWENDYSDGMKVIKNRVHVKYHDSIKAKSDVSRTGMKLKWAF